MSTNFAVTRKPQKGCCPSLSKPNGPSYPKISFEDEHLDLLKKALGELPEIDEIVAIGGARLKCCSRNEGEYGKSLTMELLSIESAENLGEEEEPGDTEEEPEESPMADMKGVKNPAMKKAMAKMMAKEKY